MPRVERTPAAEQDLQDIGYTIGVADHRPSVAEKILREIEATCRTCATQPVMGSARTDLGEHYGDFHHKRWVIIYRPLHDGIEVIRVVDGASDFPTIFRRG